MLQSDQVEELVCLISALDRAAIVHQITEFRAQFPVDFTPEFLASQSTERLRHLLFAMCVQAQHMPCLADATA
ncbi:MAG TPA: hypothetical protein VG269_12710 [Tepidisphaeraceae bacterium]|jgi:hypothetical protein|nr:hypothetical protein [Tepidisphaeraceae bacterium]